MQLCKPKRIFVYRLLSVDVGCEEDELEQEGKSMWLIYSHIQPTCN